MADDLDDFFNEIEEAEAEAVKDGDDEKETKDGATQSNNDDEADKLEEPPAKRPKTDSSNTSVAPSPAPVRPRGLVVAAASSAVVRKPARDAMQTATDSNVSNIRHLPLASEVGPMFPPPPPPPPPPPASASSNSNVANGSNTSSAQSNQPKKPIKRMAAGKVWVDPTLDEWPENDFRIFCGNLDISVSDQQLLDHFKKYASIAKAKVVQDGAGVSKGYGFVSFLQPLDCAKAIREMDQTWLGSRPIRVKRSDWKDRNMNQVLKKNKKQSKQRRRMGL